MKLLADNAARRAAIRSWGAAEFRARWGTDLSSRELRERFVAERVKWSPKHGGCLMWCRGTNDWASQGEGDYPTPIDATSALAFYDAQGAIVDWAEHDAAISATKAEGK